MQPNKAEIIKKQFILGFAYGLKYPSFKIFFKLKQNKDKKEIERINKKSKLLLSKLSLVNKDLNFINYAESLKVLINTVLIFEKISIYQKALIQKFDEAHFAIIIPTRPESLDSLNAATNALLLFINSHNIAYEKLFTDLTKKIEKFHNSFSTGQNLPHFLKSAFNLNIQVQKINNQIYQFGQGKNGMWMDSTFTENTSLIATSLARNKFHAANALKLAGLKTAEHLLVKNLTEAINAANKIGYPVVIKPADLDGGVGVYPDLQNDNEVKKYFALACKVSKNILIEKFIDARDYRLNVYQGKLLWAVERMPAGVVGDGKSSIETLISALNTTPLRGNQKKAGLKIIEIDEEVMTVLDRRNLNLKSIPRKDEFIALRKKANISTGGTPIAVMDKVHPDNAKLAIKAAEALRLDLAGVDILIKDISISWLRTDAYICEVNAQPQLGSITSKHTYSEILQKYIQNFGKIPIILILGSKPESNTYRSIINHLKQNNTSVGYAINDKVFINDDQQTTNKLSFFEKGKLLISNNNVTVICLELNETEVIKSGIPFDRFDYLIINSNHLDEEKNSKEGLSRYKEILRIILPACEKKILLSPGVNLKIQGLRSYTKALYSPTPKKDFKSLISEINLYE